MNMLKTHDTIHSEFANFKMLELHFSNFFADKI